MIADLGMRMRMRMRVNLENVLNGLEQWMGMVVDAKLSERARITRVPTPRKKVKTYLMYRPSCESVIYYIGT